jgi:hypothetical protein
LLKAFCELSPLYLPEALGAVNKPIDDASQKLHHAGCSKRQRSSPAQPRRAKTRHSAGKAAASEEAEAYPCGTLEPLSDARTKLAGFFSILI